MFKYLVRAFTLSLVVGSCTTATPQPSPSIAPPTAAPPTASPTPAPPAALVQVRNVAMPRRWATIPDGLFREPVQIIVEFDGDPTGTDPRVRLEPGAREAPLLPSLGSLRWAAFVDLAGLAPGGYGVRIVERIGGRDVVVAPSGAPSPGLVVSQPEYVVWTLDFEGDEASAETMANAAAIADAFKMPATILWNPRAWTSRSVSPEGADAMLAWTKARAAKGDEVGLHLHMWSDYVSAAGVAPRLLPRWAGRADGYDVPITAYTEDEQRKLIAYGVKLMGDHGLTGVTSFRAGGDIGDAATLRALVANGITADCTAVEAGSFGSLRRPWTLAPDAQPYVPSKDDANKPGDLPILEAPTNGGNTYAYTTSTIGAFVRADVAMLAKPGEIATARKGITVVSHPGTIDATERAAIETLFHAFDAYRFDQDKGPLRFVTLRQLAQAWR